MPTPALTEGALQRIVNQENVDRPILQVAALKKIENNQGPTRYRITLNDGMNSTSSALLSTQKNELAESGELAAFAIVQVIDYSCSVVQNRRLIMLLDFVILRSGAEVQVEIGSPKPLDNTVNEANTGGITQNAASHQGSTNGQPQHKPTVPPLMRDAAPGPAPGAKSVATTYGKGAAAGNGTVARNNAAASAANVFPLMSITPYQNKWCMRVRVTKKNPIKTYQNARGDGKLFSVDLADQSGEMRATGFNQECDKFYDFLKEGGVYFIKGGQIKSANRQYSSISNDYELTLSGETQIEPCFDESNYDLPTVTFNFVKLDKLEKLPRERVIDVIGIVESSTQCLTTMQRKTNKELKKRDVRLVDDSLTVVTLTLWSDEAENFNHDGHPVLAIKGVRISDFNGVSLSAIAGSQLHLNPDIREGHHLRGWYDSSGHSAHMKSLSNAGGTGQIGTGGGFIPFALAEADRLGTGDKPDYYNVKGFIQYVKRENCLYKACPTEECNKKLIDQGNGRHRCEKCNKEFDTFKWRLMLLITINDFSGTQQVSLFSEMAELVLKMSAQDLADLKERNEEEFNAVMEMPLFKQYSFRLRAKMELFNDESRVKVMCQRVDELNVTDYCKFLTDEIQKMEALPDPN